MKQPLEVGMLIRFAIANHRSIKEPVEMSLVAVDRDRSGARHVEPLGEHLVPVAAVYGPNASGKSNLLDAVLWFSHAVRRSITGWDRQIPRTPFRFAGMPREPTSFEVDIALDGVRYSDLLHLDDHDVIHESLLAYPERRPRQLFSREGDVVRFRRGTPKASALRELLAPGVLVLSVAARMVGTELSRVARYLGDIGTAGQYRVFRDHPQAPGHLRVGLVSTRTVQIFRGARDRDGGPEGEVHRALEMLRHADLGISDVSYREPEDPPDGPRPGRARPELVLTHRCGSEEAEFSFHEESDGTRAWFQLVGPVLDSLRTGQLLVLDEIDAILHPRLPATLVDLFRDPAANPHGAQLLFSTHDTALLAELNRDEVWFTEKGEDGATRLTALAEFGGDQVRRSLNLERAYLQGRFGALPRIDGVSMRQVLAGDVEAASWTDDERPAEDVPGGVLLPRMGGILEDRFDG